MCYIKCSCGKIFHGHNNPITSNIIQAHLRKNPTHYEVKRWTFEEK